MSFKKYLIESHLDMTNYHIVQNKNGTYSVHFTTSDGDDQEIRKHAAAHAAMHMNKKIGEKQFDTQQQAELAAQKALNVKDEKEGYHDDIEEEAPTNAVGSGENIAGINPPAGPAPLTSATLKGVAAGMTPQDIADRHGVSLEKITKQIQMGIKVEKEHTDNKKTAMKIAMDHVYEDPKYYSKLAKMEGKPKDIGNDTKFIGTKDPLAQYRVTTFQTRRNTTNKPGDQTI